MSNIRAITGSTRIMNRPSGGGSKKQGIPSSTNLNMWAHIAFANRNIKCPCNRHHVFCMNQLGGIGAGGVPGNSYMFAPTADGVNKNKILCNIDHSNIPTNILHKNIYKKLLVDNDGKYVYLVLNNNNTLYFYNLHDNSFEEILGKNLQPNKHYILDYSLLEGDKNARNKIFFTIVKKLDNQTYTYTYEIKNLSPIITISKAIYNIKLYELVTK